MPTTYTTAQMIEAIKANGCMDDARYAVEHYDMGGLKFIARACLDISIGDDAWMKFGVLYDLAQAINKESAATA